jgi:hypothetical protein
MTNLWTVWITVSVMSAACGSAPPDLGAACGAYLICLEDVARAKGQSSTLDAAKRQ